MNRTRLALLCLIASTQAAMAEESFQLSFPGNSSAEESSLRQGSGLLMLDYNKISLTNGGTFDLLGAHYLNPVTDWLYWGGGLSGPMVEGDYGGFFAVDATLHAQKKVFGNWFVDAGIGVGAGAGGSSVANIMDLSGSGLYFKKYVGLGYEGEHLNFGVNYANVQILDSPINDSTISFFIQKPISFASGAYGDSGTLLNPVDYDYRKNETMVSFEYSNLTQIDPQGSYTGDIGLVSPQFSQFFTKDTYAFFGLDLGYSGLIWYNQAQGGIGHRIQVTPNINLYGQIGIGTGGWVTDTFDTGPGLVLFPKVKAEYEWGNGIGAYFSAGYLVAPLGTSKNWSIGAGINYHLTDGAQRISEGSAYPESALKGVRINLFDRVAYDVRSNGRLVDNLNLVALQVDYNFRDNWYVPFQIAAATNEFKGYAGYVEGLVGLGWQSDLYFSDRFQAFAQIMYGMNDIGIEAKYDVGALLNASVGFNYSLNDQYAIYGQFGKTTSLGQYLEPNFTNSFENLSVGLGVTYRLSVPNRASR